MKDTILKNLTFILAIFIFTSPIISKAESNKKKNIKSSKPNETTTLILDYNPNLPPAQTAMMIKNNKNNPFFAILDIRSFEDFTNGHIPGAVNINYKLKNFEQLINDLDKEMLYIIYCNDGTKSKNTLEMMLKSGFKKVYVINGGYREWVIEGYSIERHDFCCGEQK